MNQVSMNGWLEFEKGRENDMHLFIRIYYTLQINGKLTSCQSLYEYMTGVS